MIKTTLCHSNDRWDAIVWLCIVKQPAYLTHTITQQSLFIVLWCDILQLGAGCKDKSPLMEQIYLVPKRWRRTAPDGKPYL